MWFSHWMNWKCKKKSNCFPNILLLWPGQLHCEKKHVERFNWIICRLNWQCNRKRRGIKMKTTIFRPSLEMSRSVQFNYRIHREHIAKVILMCASRQQSTIEVTTRKSVPQTNWTLVGRERKRAHLICVIVQLCSVRGLIRHCASHTQRQCSANRQSVRCRCRN